MASDLGSLAGELADVEDKPAEWQVDLPRIERAVREILAAVGEDPNREGLRETPRRVARMYAELFSGLHKNPRAHLRKFFTEKYDEMVLVRDISFNSMCEHHMLPFTGVAHIGYIPNGKVVGLSKLARVVEVVSHRPQVQERMTEEIANLLDRGAGREGRGRRDRGDALLHDDSRRPQAGQRLRHLGDEGHLPLEPLQPLGSDESHLRRPAVSAQLVHATWLLLTQFSAAAVLRLGGRHGDHVAAAGFERLLSQSSVRDAGADDARRLGGDRSLAARWRRLRHAAAVLSYVGSVCWLYEAKRAGVVHAVARGRVFARRRAACGRCAIAGMHARGIRSSTSGLVLGLTMAAMLLGHWYLNSPGMELAPLRRLLILVAVAVGVQVAGERDRPDRDTCAASATRRVSWLLFVLLALVVRLDRRAGAALDGLADAQNPQHAECHRHSLRRRDRRVRRRIDRPAPVGRVRVSPIIL